MPIIEKKCKNCGATLVEEQGKLVCKNCNTEYIKDKITNITRVENYHIVNNYGGASHNKYDANYYIEKAIGSLQIKEYSNAKQAITSALAKEPNNSLAKCIRALIDRTKGQNGRWLAKPPAGLCAEMITFTLTYRKYYLPHSEVFIDYLTSMAFNNYDNDVYKKIKRYKESLLKSLPELEDSDSFYSGRIATTIQKLIKKQETSAKLRLVTYSIIAIATIAFIIVNTLANQKFTVVYHTTTGGYIRVENTTYTDTFTFRDFKKGSTLKTVTAIPQEDYVFDRWSDGETEATRSDVVTGNKDIYAYFVTIENVAPDYSISYYVRFYATIGGYIEGETFQTVYKGTYTSAVRAVPAEGYIFVGWSDGVKDEWRSDKIIQDMSVTAEFERIPIDY